MRVIVTGATGNVGSQLVEALVEDPRVDEVVGIARRRGHWTHEKLRWAALDVAADELAPLFSGADAVVHLAWKFQPTHDPEATWTANAIGSRRVLDAIAATGVGTLVFASSVGAYSPSRAGQARRVDESWPTDSLPQCGYGREKAYCERQLDAFELQYPSVRVVRLRPAFIFGRHAASEQRRIFAGPFVPNWIVRPGVLPRLPWPRGLCFQAVHVDDVVEAYRAAIFSEVRGAYNVGADPAIGGETMAELLGTRVVEVDPRLVRATLAASWHLHLAPADPTLFDLVAGLPLLDSSRAATELGWTPRWDSIDAMRALLEGFADGSGADTAPLVPDSPRARFDELRAGVGQRDVTVAAGS